MRENRLNLPILAVLRPNPGLIHTSYWRERAALQHDRSLIKKEIGPTDLT